MGIPAIGPLTALTWTLEVGDVQRFSLIKKAIIYCGLCGAEESSGYCAAHPAFQAAQQSFTDDTDRSGHDGAALQPNATV